VRSFDGLIRRAPAGAFDLLRAVEECRKECHGGAIIAICEGLVSRPDLDADVQRGGVVERPPALCAYISAIADTA